MPRVVELMMTVVLLVMLLPLMLVIALVLRGEMSLVGTVGEVLKPEGSGRG